MQMAEIKKAPIKFKPYLKTVIWGGEKICEYKEITRQAPNIGESWEITAMPGCVSVVEDGCYKTKTITSLIDEYKEDLLGKKVLEKYSGRFPLLIKFIDASDNLSVQVHPNDALAKKRYNELGKTEMWYIISTDENAKIYAGLKNRITPEEYEKRVTDNTFMETIQEYESYPGDVFFLPGGTVHSIGAGNLLAEIQVASDITYRIYDYDRKDKNGNPRELHTELAKEAIDYNICGDLRLLSPASDDEDTNLISCQHFKVKRISCNGKKSVDPIDGSFSILMCIDGHGKVVCEDGEATIKKGSTILIPAACEKIDLDLEGSGIFLQIGC